ncbi:hypothetical protein SCOCK_750003 [Actinacidiphila cocklensis]|uniref:Uncharacterized protein n=1 Tax=Actinacidiphila cocklensis TaxID=887465 RepID=A0A9W4DYY2_9ACTN|nr:hypothetical protein SCOCK_750003 [Actinacidiphila cocklensis]
MPLPTDAPVKSGSATFGCHILFLSVG